MSLGDPLSRHQCNAEGRPDSGAFLETAMELLNWVVPFIESSRLCAGTLNSTRRPTDRRASAFPCLAPS